MNNIYKNIEEYNPDKNQKRKIVVDDMVADMLSNEKLKINCYVIILFCCTKKC